MQENFLPTLSCPFCRGKLSIHRPIRKKGSLLIHAEIVCSCDTYPLLDGVLFLKKDRAKEVAFEILSKNGNFIRKRTDLPIFLLRYPGQISRYIFLFSVALGLFRRLSFRLFVKLFILLGFYQKDWGLYLLKRNLSTKFQAFKIVSRNLKLGVRVLDTGCGAGHALAELTRKTSRETLWGVEASLPGLYLAKKYLAPGVNYLYLDLERPLPFPNGFFDAVFLNDVFHYLRRKKEVASEVSRVVRDKGSIILTNLHNKFWKKEFRGPDFPETPASYSAFFPRLKPSFFAESQLKYGFLKYLKNPGKARDEKTFSLWLSQNPPKDDIFLTPRSVTKGVKSQPF